MTKEFAVGFICYSDLPATPPLTKKSFFDTATTEAYSAKFSIYFY
jgi:hypothetical protein